MSDERERLLEAWVADKYMPERSAPRHAFRAGYDAREPEVERLRAELADAAEWRNQQIASLATAHDRVAALEAGLADARERIGVNVERAGQAEARVRELLDYPTLAEAYRAQLKRVEELVADLTAMQAAAVTFRRSTEQAETRVRELTIALGESQERLVRSQRVAEQALNERDEARKTVEAAAEALGRLTEMQSQDAGPVYCSRAVDEIRDELRALLAPKEG